MSAIQRQVIKDMVKDKIADLKRRIFDEDTEQEE